MKKFIWSMLLTAGISGTLCAQNNDRSQGRSSTGAEKIFEIDSSKVDRRFWIDLGKSNGLRLEVQSPDDLDLWENIDSVMAVFVKDFKPFKDSINDLLGSCRVDYVVDLKGRKKLRIQQYHEKGSSFLVEPDGEPIALKVEQDTVNIILITPPGKYPKWDRSPHYSRLTLYLNQFHELDDYVSLGLNEKIRLLHRNLNSLWERKNGIYHLQKDSTVTAASPHGIAVLSPGNDYLETTAAVGLGNYKSYFVPSFSVGFALNFRRPSITHEIGVTWEPNFIFQPNAQGHLQAWRNDFLTISYSQEKTNGVSVLNQLVRLSPSASLSYLIRRKGEYYDKNTFRLAMGGLRFFSGGLTIEPCLYFNNFFQQTTPGVKLNLSF